MFQSNWIKKLSDHYKNVRTQYPERKLLILFDIDGTVLNMRYMLQSLLRAYDKEHGTDYFHYLTLKKLKQCNYQIDLLIEDLPVAFDLKADILVWCLRHFHNHRLLLKSHKPYRGIFEIIRWFQLQPNTYTGFNTSKPQSVRYEILNLLNQMAKEYRLDFKDEFLFMGNDNDKSAGENKVDGVHYFKNAGFDVFAVVDHQISALKVMERAFTADPIIFINTKEILKKRHKYQQLLSIKNSRSRIYSDKKSQEDVLTHTEFVWKGIDNDIAFERFREASIFWVEVGVYQDSTTYDLIVRQHNRENVMPGYKRKLIFFSEVLQHIRQDFKGVKIDILGGGDIFNRIAEVIKGANLDDSQVWFHRSIEVLNKRDCQILRAQYPQARIQTNVDLLGPVINANEKKAERIIATLNTWGVDCFSVSVKNPDMSLILRFLCDLRRDVHVYDVYGLHSFLNACMSHPNSISSDFGLTGKDTTVYNKDNQWEIIKYLLNLT